MIPSSAESESRLMKIYEDITFHDSKSSSLKRENANINGDTSMGSMLQMGSAGAREYFLEHVLKPEHAAAHKNGDIHIHDLDFYTTTTTCTQIDLLKLFKGGFSTGHGILREPNDIQSYAALACIAIQSNQNDQHGGQSIVNFDYGLAPGVAKTFRKRYRENMIKALGLRDVFPGKTYQQLDELSVQVDTTLAEKGLFIHYLEGSDHSPNKEYLDAEFEAYGFDWTNEKECNQIEAFLSCQQWAYAEAVYETERATYQAMEGLVHNLNTMHCLPASEKIWVKDETGVHLLSMKEIYDTFEPGKYEVYSLNCKTGTTELKPITAVKEKSDHRDLVRLRTASGLSVVTTTNHRIPSYKDGAFTNIEAKDVKTICIAYDHEDGKSFDPNENSFSSTIVIREFFNSGDEKVYDISVADNETFLTKDCIFVHNSRAGAQVPFSSINYGMDTSPEGRLVTRSVLLAHEAGLGGGETPIFPIHVFRVCDGINSTKGDLNYDLFQLACRVSAKRLFPNFVFQDAHYNMAYYNGTPETECASMGCTGGSETIKYRIDNSFLCESFQDAWNRVKSIGNVQKHGHSEYIDVNNVEIYDSHTDGFVKVLRFIKNPDQGNWKEIIFSNGQSLRATGDHPLPVIGKGRTFVQDMQIGDKIPTARTEHGLFPQTSQVEVMSINNLGFLNKPSFDVETESDYFDVSDIISHNCRTRVIANVHDPDKAISWSRGNLSFTSINLPRLAINAKGDKTQFFQALDSTLSLCIDQLLDRLEYQSRRKKKNFPFLMNGVWLDSDTLGPEDEVREVLKHGTLSVGFIGLAETLVALTGKHHGENEKSQKLGLEIIGFMRQRLDEEAEKRKLNFSLLATPAEGLSGRFIELDKAKYGVIPGVIEREYYTNSFHVPVWYEISIADKIRIEAPYHALCNAGHITYVELNGDVAQNVEAFEKIIQLMKTSGIGYGAINHPIDHDPVCGYNGIINDTCPKCGRKETNDKPFERIRRITGYLVGSLDRFNDAKRAEVADRIAHQW